MSFFIALLAGVLGIIPVFLFKKLEKDTKWMFSIVWGIIYTILGWIFISACGISLCLLIMIWWLITGAVLFADKV